MYKTAFICLLTVFTCFVNRSHAQVAATTYEGTDADLNNVYNTYLGTMGKNPQVLNSPLPSDWWSVINIRHRNGGGDGISFGSQIAVGMTYHRNRMFFRGHYIGIWDPWTEVFTPATPRLLINGATDDGVTTLQVNGEASAIHYMAKQQAGISGNVLYTLGNGAGVKRFGIGHGDVESGSNTGSNFNIYAYADNGQFTGSCFTINRASGNVGIGTSNPQAKLAVKGVVFAQKVKVTQKAEDWPDYVFDASYQLPSLAETEQFIRKHKHLQDIPAAAEIARDGQDLGEMNKKLLQKVEELTLHLIEMQKQMNAQQEELKKIVKKR